MSQQPLANLAPEIQEELEQLLRELIDGEPSLAAQQRLAEQTMTYPQALAYYVHWMHMHTEMAYLLSESSQIGEAPTSNRLPTTTPVALITAAGKSPSLLKTGYWKSHRARFGMLALTLTLLFWVGIFGFIMFGGNTPSNDATNSNRVATITDIRDAVWAEGAHAYTLQDGLETTATLELTSGYVEVTFQHGAVVLLEAPVNFTVDTRGAGTLQSGRLVARIEKQPKSSPIVPFAVTTPLTQVIDRGTCFGVEAAEDGSTLVEVFEGRIEATLLTNASERIVLMQGDSARIAPSDVAFQRQERSGTQFVQEVPDEGTQVITPVAVVASLEGTRPEECINGSGLTSSGPIGAWTHTTTGAPLSCWGTFVLELPVTLTFDLGAEYELSTVWFWNFSHAQGFFSQRCTKTIGVEISSDGDHYTSLGQLVLPPFTEDPTPGQRYSIDHRARYVRIEILDSYMPAGARLEAAEVGLGEVRFEGIPAER